MKLVLGVGCDRGASQQTLESAIDQALALVDQPRSAVTALATIDKKNDEAGLLSLAAQHQWPIHFYAADALAAVPVPSPSETVRKYMGTPAVAEAAALLAAGSNMDDLLLEKFKYRGSDGKNATVSIAQRSHPGSNE